MKRPKLYQPSNTGTTSISISRYSEMQDEYIDQLEKQRGELLEALKGFYRITQDSTGVNGFHMNGNEATWEIDFAEEMIKAEQAIKNVEQ